MKTKSEMQEPIPGELRNIPLLDAENGVSIRVNVLGLYRVEVGIFN